MLLSAIFRIKRKEAVEVFLRIVLEHYQVLFLKTLSGSILLK